MTLESLKFDPNNCQGALESLPTISFEFGDGHSYKLAPEDYLLGSLKAAPRDSDAKFSPKQLESCIAGIAALNIPSRAGSRSATWIFGDLFLSKYYLSFDKKRLRIGIATARTGPTMEERVKKTAETRRKAERLSQL